MRFVLVFLISIVLASNNVWGIQLAIQSVTQTNQHDHSQHHEHADNHNHKHAQHHVLLEQSETNLKNKMACWCCKISTSAVGLISNDRGTIEDNRIFDTHIEEPDNFISITSSPPIPPPIVISHQISFVV